MMHEIGSHLAQHDCFYTPYYCDGLLRWLGRSGLLEFTVLGGELRRLSERHLDQHRLPRDERGKQGPYDLIVTCSDLVVQKNVRGRPLVLVQEGMSAPEDLGYRLVRTLKLPRWLESTAATGLSLAVDLGFAAWFAGTLRGGEVAQSLVAWRFYTVALGALAGALPLARVGPRLRLGPQLETGPAAPPVGSTRELGGNPARPSEGQRP